MVDTSPQTPVDTLTMALAGARLDPRVEAISRSLGLNLADESLWQRVRGDTVRNHQLLRVAGSSPEVLSIAVKGTTGLSRNYIIGALAAYEVISRL